MNLLVCVHQSITPSHRRLGRLAWLATVLGLITNGALVFGAPRTAAAAPITVTPVARASCDGGAYTLHWDLTNEDATNEVVIVRADQSGAATDAVAFTPATVPAGSRSSATFGPLDGHTTGTVTLTLQLRSGADTTTQTAEIPLRGLCWQQTLAPPTASVTPLVVPSTGVITVSGAQCPLDQSWLGSTPSAANWHVSVTLTQVEPVPAAIVLPLDGAGTNTFHTAKGTGIAPGPGGAFTSVTPDPSGAWSATLDLASGTSAIPKGIYGVIAVCQLEVDPAGGIITYQTPALTVADDPDATTTLAPATPVPATPVPATPSLTG